MQYDLNGEFNFDENSQKTAKIKGDIMQRALCWSEREINFIARVYEWSDECLHLNLLETISGSDDNVNWDYDTYYEEILFNMLYSMECKLRTMVLEEIEKLTSPVLYSKSEFKVQIGRILEFNNVLRAKRKKLFKFAEEFLKYGNISLYVDGINFEINSPLQSMIFEKPELIIREYIKRILLSDPTYRF